MERINLTMEVLQNILIDIKRDSIFDEIEKQISNGAVLYLLNSLEDQRTINVITTIEELNNLRKI